MSNLTRNGIAYNFKESPYFIEIEYGEDVVRYIFSSQLNIERFNTRQEENRKKISDSLSKRFNFNIKNDVLCDLKLYTSIEKRGFLIFKNEEMIECQKSITLDGNNLIMKS